MRSLDNTDSLIMHRYAELAIAIVTSSINDYCRMKVQEHYYPKEDEKRLIREEVGGDQKKMERLLRLHEKVRTEGRFSYKFLNDPGRVGFFTPFTSEELLSIANRKTRMMIEDLDERGTRRMLRNGYKRNKYWREVSERTEQWWE